MKMLSSIVLTSCSLLFFLSSCKKEDKLGPFAGTVWQGKLNVENISDPKTFGYRIVFSNDGKYRTTELDKDGYAYVENSTGTYSYTPPKLVLRSDRGGEVIFHYFESTQTFRGYEYVTFFKQ